MTQLFSNWLYLLPDGFIELSCFLQILGLTNSPAQNNVGLDLVYKVMQRADVNLKLLLSYFLALLLNFHVETLWAEVDMVQEAQAKGSVDAQSCLRETAYIAIKS